MDEAIVYGVLVLTLSLLISGRLRYDLVALGALLVLTVAGVVPASEAYMGFAHPAAVTVVAVLILSRALQNCRADRGDGGLVFSCRTEPDGPDSRPCPAW